MINKWGQQQGAASCLPRKAITWVVSASKSGNRSPSSSATGWANVAILEQRSEDASVGLLLVLFLACRAREVLAAVDAAGELRQARVMSNMFNEDRRATKDIQPTHTETHPRVS